MNAPASSTPAPAARKLPLRRKLFFSFVPLVTLLVAGELLLRIRWGAVAGWPNARAGYLETLRSNIPAAHDAELGWVPRAGATGADNAWHTQVSIDERGLRKHAPVAPAGAPSILVTGDSFAFGEGVDDDQTWPARLGPRASGGSGTAACSATAGTRSYSAPKS
jgi:hypothetical protein